MEGGGPSGREHEGVDDPALFFDGWRPVVRTAILTPVAYAALILFLRAAGKRSIAQLNVFDWVVTVALGSALAALVITPDVALVQGLVGIGGLIALQYLLSLATSRWERLRGVVTAEPVLLVRDGELLRAAMRRERVAESEVLQALRQAGKASPDQASAVILESNGTFAVVGEGTADAAALPEARSGR